MNKDSTGFVVMKSLSSFADGRNPRGALVQDGTNLYGLANYGGTFNYGTAFVIDKDTAGFNVIHHFQSGALVSVLSAWFFAGYCAHTFGFMLTLETIC